MVSRASFRILVPVVLCLGLTFSPVAVSQQHPKAVEVPRTSNGKFSRERILVKFRRGMSGDSRAAVHATIGAHTLRQYTAVRDLEAVGLPLTLDVSAALRYYRLRPEVEYAEPDYTVHLFETPNDPMFSQMWNLLNTGQNGGTVGDDVGATLAWNLATGDHNVIVATIDTGIDYTHPDLIPNLFHNAADCNGVDDGSNGCYGISTVYYTSSVFDDNGHGTHVSGIVGAAGNNSLGVVGINWNVQLMSCKFLDSTGSGQTSDAISCLDYVLQMKNSGYNIVATNNSWGSSEYSQALTDAIQAQQQAGILFIAASGNTFSDDDITPTYPANTLLPNVISVAATTRTDALSVFSNLGQHSVHLGAPGEEILSTWPGNNYAVLSGTSMATPHITGAAALLLAQQPALDWRGIKNLILAGGDSRSSLAQTITGKRLNLNGSMTCSGKSAEGRLQPVNNVIAATAGVAITLEELNVNCAQPAGNVQVTVSPGGQTITLVDDGTGADQAAGDGYYTGQWTPPSVGSFTLTFPGGDVVDAEVLNNYVAAPTTYNYVSFTGTNLNLGDDSVEQITSPFPIAFGGGSFTTLQVGSNGTISFTDAYSSFMNGVIPGLSPVPVTLVAPFWQDLYPVAGSAQNVYWGVVGSAPNRQLVVEWRSVRSFLCHDDSAATVTFEVVFSESSGNILFQYADTVFGDYCYFQDAGGRATVGVQVSPTVGTMWTVNDPVIVSGSALLWTVGNNSLPENPVPNVSSLSPPSVPIGSSSFNLTVNGTGFVPTSAVTFSLFEQPTTYVSSTKLTAEIPAGSIAQAGASTYVWVTNPAPGGGQSNLVTFALSDGVPSITSLSPPSVTAGSFSFTLTINGTGFGQASLYWNGTLLEGGGPSAPNQLQVGIPYTLIASPGTVQITVVNAPPGGGTSNTATFTILPQGQSPGFLQPPLLQNRRGNAFPMTPASPTRFLGWKYAARAGSNYQKAFSRSRAQKPLPAPNPAQSKPTGAGISAMSPATPPPPAGLQLKTLLPADYIPTAVAAGDFNGDGIPDWVVSNGGSNNLWVYLGRGDGTFTQATVIPLTGQSPLAVVAADLRGVGKLDIVVAEADSESIGVLLGNGDGTFASEQTYFVPGAPISMAIADLNHDGHLDVVAGILPDPNIAASGAVVSLLGDGSGAFGAPLFEPYLNFGVQDPESIVVADFEGNGKPDAVVVDPGVGAVVYVNNGNGLLKEAQPIDAALTLVGVSPISLTSGDVNEDGCPDVVVFDSLAIARVFLGNCDSTFQAQSTEVGEGDFAWASALVDVNGDGHLDLVYSGIAAQTGYGQVAGNLLAVHFGDGKGNFGPAQVYRGGQTSFGLAVADFNRDGHPDIITANQDSDSASMFLNDGKGGFGTPGGEYVGYINGNNSSGPVNAPFTSFFPADVNGDGSTDLVLIEDGPGYPNPLQATVMLNDGTGHFGAAIHSPVAEGTFDVTDFLLADFRNTGRPDLVTISSYFGEGSNPQLVFAPNAGGGSFGPPAITNIPLSGTLAAGDFNHDGNLDLAIATGASGTGTATITIYLGHGDGTFAAQPPINFNTNSAGHWIQGLWVGDFNGDGKLDILAWFYLNVVPFQNNDVYEFLGNGDGTFAPAKLVIQNLSNPAVADFNHDGRPDVVDNRDPEALYPNLGDPQFRIFLCQPDGTFTLTNTYEPYGGQANVFLPTLGTANGGRFPAFLGDFNGDGNVDLAAIQQASGDANGVYYVQFLLGNGDGTFTPSYTPYFLNASQPTTAFDVTGDGRADLIESDVYTSSFQVIPGGIGAPLQLQLAGDPVIGSTGLVVVSLPSIAATATQVPLAASDPAITIPASITIPAGSLTQEVQFTIGSSFNSSHVLWIQGTLNGSTAFAYGTQATALGQYGIALSLNSATEATFPGLPTENYQLVMSSIAGYSTEVNLTCKGLPAGSSCQFGTGGLSVLPGESNSTSLIINTTSSTPMGVYPIQITASDGTVSSQVTATLDVGDYSVSVSPGIETVLQNGTASYSLNVTSTNNYGGPFTGTCTGIPSPAVCSVSLANANTTSIQANGLAIGNYNFSVGLSNGLVTRSASAQFNIGDFNATLSANSLSVAVGQSSNVTVNVTGQNGFTDPVALTCSGTPSGSNCGINPPFVTPSASGTPATLTINVTTAPPQNQLRKSDQKNAVMFSFGMAGLAGLMLALVSRSGRGKGVFLCLTLFVLISLSTSCGGGGSSSGGSGGGGAGGGGGGTGVGGGGSTSFNITVQASSDGVTKNVGTVQVTVP
ncbi:MAG TPA: FG-GAP-like repeat-containing protein [Candidatus Sulfotelmatobacter sp.]|nr:FG-GAP-like repeat-containing protein [Candidatus Sulfotelmatobacter sp.]